MRFRRRQRFESFTLSQRMAMAFERNKRRERERYPLFAEEIQAGQRSAEDEIARRNRVACETEARMRNLHARFWRQGRERFFAASPEQQAAIREFWKNWTGPLDSTYYSYAVDLCTGEYARRCAAAKEFERGIRRRVYAGAGVQTSLHLEAA